MVHLVREAEREPEGALILNHGRGADERDLYGLLDELDPDRRLVGITPGAPLTGIPPGGRHWYVVPRVGYPDRETFARAYRELTSFSDELLQARGIGWDRTVIGGFSMGAVMSYAVGLGPGRPSPAGIMALSGFVPTVEGWHAELEQRSGLGILIRHGRSDPVIGVEFARRAQELLAGAGLEVDYAEFEGGHWLPADALGELRAFIAAALGGAETSPGAPG